MCLGTQNRHSWFGWAVKGCQDALSDPGPSAGPVAERAQAGVVHGARLCPGALQGGHRSSGVQADLPQRTVSGYVRAGQQHHTHRGKWTGSGHPHWTGLQGRCVSAHLSKWRSVQFEEALSLSPWLYGTFLSVPTSADAAGSGGAGQQAARVPHSPETGQSKTRRPGRERKSANDADTLSIHSAHCTSRTPLVRSADKCTGSPHTGDLSRHSTSGSVRNQGSSEDWPTSAAFKT